MTVRLARYGSAELDAAVRHVAGFVLHSFTAGLGRDLDAVVAGRTWTTTPAPSKAP